MDLGRAMGDWITAIAVMAFVAGAVTVGVVWGIWKLLSDHVVVGWH